MSIDVDIVRLVRGALDELGCGDKVDDALSPHAPICINFRDGTGMTIETDNDGVRFSAPIPDVTESNLAHIAGRIVDFVLRAPTPLFSPARPVLLWFDGRLMLQAVLAPEATTLPAFQDALAVFFEETRALLFAMGR
jgi:hypothetical protein